MRRAWTTTGPVLAVAAGAIVALILFAIPARRSGGLDPAGPDGTLALQRFLAGTGSTVRPGETPPGPPGTFVLLSDLRDEGQVRGLLSWARSGGRLVVADPGSLVVDLLGLTASERIGGVFGTSKLSPACAAPEAAGVDTLIVRVSDMGLAGMGPGETACFRRSGRAYAVVTREGAGTVIVLGGPSALSNDLLDDGDNATFAAQALSSGGPVVFGPALPSRAPAVGPRRSPGLWSLLPARAKAVVLTLALAALAFALARARRVGRPPLEEPIAPIPASDLVRAASRLYRSARAAGFAGRLLRQGAARRMARRIGVPPGTPPEDLATILPLPPGEEGRALREALTGPEPASDENLIALGREIERLRARVEEGKR
jgi:hypothetical protein